MPCAEMYAYGPRNPFRIAFDANSARDRFFISDAVCPHQWGCFAITGRRDETEDRGRKTEGTP